MRKFRGLTKEGKWVYGYFIQRFDNLPLKNRAWIIPLKMGLRFFNDRTEVMDTIEVIPETVGQSTGLEHELIENINWWEGDILQSIDGRKGVIKYSEIFGEFAVYNESNHRMLSAAGALCDGWRKIGNIHENKELLNETPNGKANRE